MPFLRKLLPKKFLNYYSGFKQKQIAEKKQGNKKLSANDFQKILKDEFGIEKGSIVVVHSSIDRLNIDLSAKEILNALMEAVGEEGTLLFPTYPALPSYEFLISGEVWDIKRTPSFSGLLSEVARRTAGSKRSLHPTKSVCAIGKNAEYFINEHHLSPYPYDKQSPYFKVIEQSGISIGLGVTSNYFSSTHVVDDYFKDDFPVMPYHKQIFEAKCLDYDREIKIVRTYAHNIRKMKFNIPLYFKKYVSSEIARDFQLFGMDFFYVKSKPLFDRMCELVENRITIYKKIYYKPSKIFK
ncbi:MAG: AAC(3) family N-acetyltransferase [Candidatus Kapabacteria bacterium]|nr:AAC(3) family N-acetyltransferase [Candidatus Kapabacteria bacterium]